MCEILHSHSQHNIILSHPSSLHTSLVLIMSQLFFNPHWTLTRLISVTLLLVILSCPRVIYMFSNVYVSRCGQVGALGWYRCSCVVMHTSAVPPAFFSTNFSNIHSLYLILFHLKGDIIFCSYLSFWFVFTWKGSHALMFRKHHFPQSVHRCSSSSQPLSHTLGFSSCLFKTPWGRIRSNSLYTFSFHSYVYIS